MKTRLVTPTSYGHMALALSLSDVYLDLLHCDVNAVRWTDFSLTMGL